MLWLRSALPAWRRTVLKSLQAAASHPPRGLTTRSSSGRYTSPSPLYAWCYGLLTIRAFSSIRPVAMQKVGGSGEILQPISVASQRNLPRIVRDGKAIVRFLLSSIFFFPCPMQVTPSVPIVLALAACSRNAASFFFPVSATESI